MSAIRRSIRSRKLLFLMAAPPLAVLLAALGLFLAGAFQGKPGTAEAQQPPPTSSMDTRLNQIIAVLQEGPPGAAEQALDSAMEILYGGLRPLPSKDSDQSEQANKMMSDAEMKLARALEGFVHRQDVGSDMAGRALDLKLFIEQMNEVAEAVGMATRKCGEGDKISLDPKESPCADLIPLLDEERGDETGVLANAGEQIILPPFLHRSYSVKLRSPFIPRWGHTWDEDVMASAPIGLNECSVVFKETRGLMLRAHFDRIIVVTDPWITIFGVPRGTAIPIWRLEWVPSEYVKTFSMCNRDGKIALDVQQRVVQDHALNFFWRYYPARPRLVAAGQ